MRILIIAFEFPPSTLIGAVRPYELARHWAISGHDVTVIAGQYDVEQIGARRNFSPLPSNVDVRQIECSPYVYSTSRLLRWLKFFFSFVGDRWADQWRDPLAVEWKGVMRDFKPEVIFVTIPPFSMAPLICDMAKVSEIPVILDFRDAWSQWSTSPRTTWIHYQLQLRAERRCLRIAKRITCVTQQLVDDLAAVHPNIDLAKFSVVPNGIDCHLEDFHPIRKSASDAPFIIGYVGRFYFNPAAREAALTPWWQRPIHRWMHFAPRREDWLYRSPWFFLKCISHLVTRYPERRQRVKVRFVGEPEGWLVEQITRLGLEDVVELVGTLPHRECLEFQSACDALLLTSVKVLGGYDFCIAGKTFEYFATGRPIIGCVTPGEQRNILLKSGTAIICDPDQLETAVDRLVELMDGSIPLARDDIFLSTYDRRSIAADVLNTMKEVISPKM